MINYIYYIIFSIQAPTSHCKWRSQRQYDKVCLATISSTLSTLSVTTLMATCQCMSGLSHIQLHFLNQITYSANTNNQTRIFIDMLVITYISILLRTTVQGAFTSETKQTYVCGNIRHATRLFICCYELTNHREVTHTYWAYIIPIQCFSFGLKQVVIGGWSTSRRLVTERPRPCCWCASNDPYCRCRYE